MNKKNKLSNNNKGVALITIVIAVAFISIISSALMYITFMNYQMKVLNLNSKENFYETDGELVKITAGLRNSIEKPEDFDKLLIIPGSNFAQDATDKNLYTAPASAVRLTGTNGILDSAGLWDNVNNTYAPHNDGDTFTYTVGGVTKYLSGSLTTYTIKDLKVNQISKDGYSNSVQTDLQIKVKEQTGGTTSDGGLGKCSVLLDSNIRIAGGEFAFVTFFGNTYCANYGDTTASFNGSTEVYTVPSKWAGAGGSTSEGSDEDSSSSIKKTKHTRTDVANWVFQNGDFNQNLKNFGVGAQWYESVEIESYSLNSDNSTYTVVFYIIDSTGGSTGGSGGGSTTSSDGSEAGSALYLKDHTKVNVQGDNLVVYGDVVLTGSSCLNIATGKLKVFGDIYLLDNSTLICGGEIYFPEHPLPGRGASDYCGFKTKEGVTASDEYLKKHLYYKGTIHTITDAQFDDFAQTLNLKGSDTSNDGIVNKIAKPITLSNGKTVTIFDNHNCAQNIPGSFYGENCGVSFMMGGNVGNLDAYTNYLVFMTDNGNPSGTDYNLNASNVHSTFVSRASVYLNVQKGIYYTQMGPELYDYLRISSSSNKYYAAPKDYYDEMNDPEHKNKKFGSVHSFSVKFDSTGETIDDMSVSDLLEENTNTYINNLFNVGSSDSSVKSYINSATFHNYIKDAD